MIDMRALMKIGVRGRGLKIPDRSPSAERELVAIRTFAVQWEEPAVIARQLDVGHVIRAPEGV
jgi:hypothetical protein